jgi:glucose-6-phosphate isomerase
MSLFLSLSLQINTTEDRAVLHVALRAPRHEQICCDGKNAVSDVWEVLDKIKDFTNRVRNGTWVSKSSAEVAV